MTCGTVYPGVSITAAFIFLIGNAYTIITNWVPPKQFGNPGLAWFLIPVISFCVLGFSALWLVGFLTKASRRKNKQKEEFVLRRHPKFDWTEGGGKDEGLVLVHETINLCWQSVNMDGLMNFENGNRGSESYQL